MNIRNLILLFFTLATLASCDKKDSGELEREILVTTMWLEEVSTEEEGIRKYIYDFGEGGMVDLYLLINDTRAELETSGRYIFDPVGDKLAIETKGAFEVREITVDILKLKPNSSAPTFTLRRYDRQLDFAR